MSFKPENATLEELIARATRPAIYDMLIERLARGIEVNPDTILAELYRPNNHVKFAVAVAQREPNPLNLFVKLFGDNLENVLSIYGEMIDMFVPVGQRKKTVIDLFKAAPPFCDCLLTLRKHLTDREIVALIQDTVRTCDVNPDTIQPDGTFNGGRDFIVTLLNPANVKLVGDKHTWYEGNGTWLSLFNKRQLIELLDLCNKRRPGTLVAHRRMGMDWTSDQLIGAYLDFIDASATMRRLVHNAFGSMTDLSLADPDLFLSQPHELQESLLRQHKGGNILLLIMMAIELDDIRTFQRYGPNLLESTDIHLIAGVFENVRAALQNPGEITGEIANELRYALQRAGFTIATIDYTAGRAVVGISGVTYHPKSPTHPMEHCSDLRQARVPHIRVEVAFDPNAFESTLGNNKVGRMYHIA